MRRRSGRKKQPQKQPASSVSTPGPASAVCDSSPPCFPYYFFPLFYSLLFIWIALLALNPALSHYAGSHPRSVPWLSGVRADVNNAEHGGPQNASAVYAQSLVLPLNESASASAPGLPQEVSTGPTPDQDCVCSHLSFEDYLFSIVFPANCPFPNDGKKKCSRSWDLSRVLESNSKNDSEIAVQASELLAIANHLSQDPCVSQDPEDGVNDDINDISETRTSNLLEGQDKHGDFHHDHIDHHEYNKSGISDQSMKNEEHQNLESLNNHTDASYPCDTTKETNSSVSLDLSDIVNKTHPSLTNLSKIHLRQDPGDGPYNYASDSKGAKILANNKEAKGASNILNKDKDKYFRTPCNVESKYVDLELSEETLVIEIAIANHEFYSSNVREFTLWGSLTYPAEEWNFLGKFEAGNLRSFQSFRLQDPQWVRYLKLQMLSHYGSDFYCTLSVVEVFGVDAIEWFLEDWIAEESGLARPPSFSKGAKQPTSSESENSSTTDKAVLPVAPERHATDEDRKAEEDLESTLNRNLEENISEKSEDGKSSEKPQPVYHQTGRPALDAVMKLLMQKVRTLENKQPLLTQSLEEMEARYREVVGTHNTVMALMVTKVESMATELTNLNALLHFMEGEWTRERHDLEVKMVDQFKIWNADFELLRHELRRTEEKELVAMAVSFFSLFTVIGVQVLMMCLPIIRPAKEKEALLLSCTKMLWAVPFMGCILVVIVLSV